MDLTILFSPVDDQLYADIASHASFFKNIKIFGDKMPAYKDAHIAIFGVKESRGGENNAGASKGPDEIRRKLYNLKKGNGSYRIVDLGNLNPGHDLDETYVRISEVCRMLLENNVLPVVIGGTHDLDYGQYSGYETMSKLVSLLNIDAFLDLEDKKRSRAKPAAHSQDFTARAKLSFQLHTPGISELPDRSITHSRAGEIILRGISHRADAHKHAGNGTCNPKCRYAVVRHYGHSVIRCSR